MYYKILKQNKDRTNKVPLNIIIVNDDRILFFAISCKLTYSSLQHISLLKDRNLIFWLSCCCPPGSFCLPGPCNTKHQLGHINSHNSQGHMPFWSVGNTRNLIFLLSCCCPPGSFCLPGPCNRQHQLGNSHNSQGHMTFSSVGNTRNLIFWLSCCCPPGSFRKHHQLGHMNSHNS